MTLAWEHTQVTETTKHQNDLLVQTMMDGI